MVYPTPIIIPVSRGHHSISTGAVPLSASIAVSSLIIALMLLLGFMWWEMIDEFKDSKLGQIILTLIFFLLEVGLTCVLVGFYRGE